MSDIKRLNYFNGQFLVETDFNDEQAYHLGMRRRLTQAFQTWGVADGGLQVTTVSGNNKQVSVGAGMALDNQGREIVVLTPRTLDLSANAPNSDVYITVEYEEIQDPADHYAAGGVDNYTRWTERPDVLASTTLPAAEGAVIPLARVHLDGSGNVASIEPSIRPVANSKIDPATNLQLGSLSVSGNVGIGLSAAPTRKLEIGGTTGNLLSVGASGGSTANIELAGHVQLREYSTDNLAYFQARDDGSNRDIGLRIRTQKAGASTRVLTEALTIDGNGDVGIGMTNPEFKLDISGSVRFNLPSTGSFTDFRINKANGTLGLLISNNGAIGVGALDTGIQLDIRSGQGGTGNSAIRAIYPGGGSLTGSEFAALAHRSGAWAALYAKQGAASSAASFDGNVGIGTMTPQAQLHVSSFAAIGPITHGQAIGRLEVSGASAELGFMRRTLTAWPSSPAAGDRFVWYNPNGTARLWTEVKGDLLTIDMNGYINSPMWKVTTVYNYIGGPLPRSNGTFTSGGGTLLIFASGSGFRGAAAGMIGMRIRIDGTERGVAQCFTNEVGSHKTFVTNCLVVGGIAADDHSVTLEAMDTLTLTDSNDRFDLTILELPFQSFVFTPIPIPIPPIVLTPQ